MLHAVKTLRQVFKVYACDHTTQAEYLRVNYSPQPWEIINNNMKIVHIIIISTFQRSDPEYSSVTA